MLSYGVRYAMLVGRVREHRHPRCSTPSMNFDHSRRLLFGALLSSLLLHLVLVFGWGWARPLPPSLPQPAMQVVVSVRSAVSTASPLPSHVPEKMPPRVFKRPVLTAPPAVERPLAAAPLTEVVPASTGQEVREVVTAPIAVGPAKAKPENEGVSADGLRQYRIELAGAARRFRDYPALARGRGWEGVAEVSVSMNAGLPAPSLKLVKSSGHGVLDEQAMEMLSRAVAATPLPESLLGRSFAVPMPIRFSLEE